MRKNHNAVIVHISDEHDKQIKELMEMTGLYTKAQIINRAIRVFFGGKKIQLKPIPLAPALKAIRKYCLSHSKNSKQEVQNCCAKNCPLYPFRMNKKD